MNELTELCPICIDKEANVFTECNHGYCISCVCRINKCAMCRKPLQRNKLSSEITNWHSKKAEKIFENNRKLFENLPYANDYQIEVEFIYNIQSEFGRDNTFLRNYAINYNVLRIMSGLGLLAYSN